MALSWIKNATPSQKFGAFSLSMGIFFLAASTQFGPYAVDQKPASLPAKALAPVELTGPSSSQVLTEKQKECRKNGISELTTPPIPFTARPELYAIHCS